MKREEAKLYYVQGLAVPETPKPNQDPKPWKEPEVIGKPLPRVDAYERVSGSAIYPSDTSLPDMLYGAILRCPHPHARVRGVETSDAEKMPGVRAVITGKTSGAGMPPANEIISGCAVNFSNSRIAELPIRWVRCAKRLSQRVSILEHVSFPVV